MRAAILLLALAAFGVFTAFASAVFATTPTCPIETCLSSAGDDEAAQTACIGQFASSCIANSPGGETTAGMVQCAQAERAQWENVRGAQVIALRAIESPRQIALLDVALDEHGRWAEAHCSYRASIYEGGSLSIVVAAQCMNTVVAEHALYLRNRYSED
jgi:hypothetical protein